MVQKNIVSAYDRLIFLEDGEYQIEGYIYNNQAAAQFRVMKNKTDGTTVNSLLHVRIHSTDCTVPFRIREVFSRGDYVYCFAPDVGTNAIHGSSPTLNQLNITKLN